MWFMATYNTRTLMVDEKIVELENQLKHIKYNILRQDVYCIIEESLLMVASDLWYINIYIIIYNMIKFDWRWSSYTHLQVPTQRKKYIILIGELNAKIGHKPDDSQFVVRLHGYGDRNETGKTLIEFLLQQGLYIMNTYLSRKKRDLGSYWIV